MNNEIMDPHIDKYIKGINNSLGMKKQSQRSYIVELLCCVSLSEFLHKLIGILT